MTDIVKQIILFYIVTVLTDVYFSVAPARETNGSKAPRRGRKVSTKSPIKTSLFQPDKNIINNQGTMQDKISRGRQTECTISSVETSFFQTDNNIINNEVAKETKVPRRRWTVSTTQLIQTSLLSRDKGTVNNEGITENKVPERRRTISTTTSTETSLFPSDINLTNKQGTKESKEPRRRRTELTTSPIENSLIPHGKYLTTSKTEASKAPRSKRVTTTGTTESSLFPLYYNMSVIEVSILQNGFMLSLPDDDPNISHLEVFASVNQPMMLSKPYYKPNYTAIIKDKKDGMWSYVNTDITLQDDDRVYYWISIVTRDNYSYCEFNDRMFIVRNMCGKLVPT